MADDTERVQRALTDDDSSAAKLIARYLTGTALLRDAVAGMTLEQLQARPVPGKMSSQEVVAHVVDADQYMADRMKRTIATDRPLLVGVESVDYLRPLHYAEHDVVLDLRLLEATREQMAGDLRRLSPEAWQRTGVHSEIGLVTLRRLMLHAIRHLENHIAAIDEKREVLGLGGQR